MSLGSFSLWSFVAGLLVAYFVLPFLLTLVSGKAKSATKG